jgi:DNA-directed RNA polymerase specialized sigma24 family protein
MDDADTKELLAKLDAVIRLLVFGMAEGKDQTEQIRLLSLAGFQPKKIAEMLGTTANNVRVRLSSLRKKRKANSL